MSSFLMQLDPFWVALLSLGVYATVLLLFFKYGGQAGLYVYMAVAIIGANLQVLKVSYFEFLQSPVALGTALFSSIYLATDLLSEYYNPAAARKGVLLSFAALLLWTILTTLLLAFAPLTPAQAGADYQWALTIHPALIHLFQPVPAIFVASLTAFLISQSLDIFIYSAIKKRTHSKWLFVRNNFSTILSTLIDNAVFSFIAFVLLAKNPIATKELIFTYILGTYALRILYALLDTPFIYLARFFKPKALRL
ncbi:hypothetical protein COTS27_01217 [Spirochaetota bacterium]|nr:hypothetical protein COTS27_01217 [Spirochaetota bacterium]